ncbi:MAG: RNA polymerase factor sigma-54 [Prevotellaceae bacterium]|jgi:RNA polymerase sigma-54 factor|nr:RNA polymerase factor sigma-54 [Prevotellaceae bacterium]
MLKQTTQLKLQQKLSPLQIQTIKLLELPIMQFNQRVKEELEENPALDEEQMPDDEHPPVPAPDDDTPAYKLYNPSFTPPAKPEFPTLSAKENFRQQLDTQIGYTHLNEHQRTIASYLIGNLDDDGYLRRELPAIADDLAFHSNIHSTPEELQQILAAIQDLDPPGIAARNLQECLLIQLQKHSHPTPSQQIAIQIIRKHFNNFGKKHYQKIKNKLQIDDQTLKKAIHEITKLNPRPANSHHDSYNDQARQIVPDFLLELTDGQPQLSLLRYNTPQLLLNKHYAQLTHHTIPHAPAKNRAAATFIRQKTEDAARFIEAIKQRQQTLLTTMQTILNYQHEYFLDGDETKLRPMTLRHIADRCGYDISTISRVVNSKYIQTHFGIYPLKHFFSEAMKNTAGEEISTREIKTILQQTIQYEDKKKPLPDAQLTTLLKQRGYNLARRTVAKYREQLNIPVARLRKEL